MSLLHIRTAYAVKKQFLKAEIFNDNMDEKKIIKLKEYAEKKEPECSSLLHTNPIIKERLLSNSCDKNSKFSIKDLFKQ